MKHIALTSFLAFLIVLVGGVSDVVACSCARTATIDSAFEKTPNVVIVRLIAVEKAPASEQIYPGVERLKYAVLSVEKIYKGNLKVGQQMKFAQGSGADCVWIFPREAIGEDFLLFLDDKPLSSGVWVASTCSRSNQKDWATSDLMYIDNLQSVRGKTRLSGTVIQHLGSPFYGSSRAPEVLSRRKVMIAGGGKKLELVTDANGVYEVYGLPAGKYTITPEPVAGYRIGYFDAVPSVETELPPSGHAEANIVFSIDNRISGKFIDRNGSPLKNVCLRLRPRDSSEADGKFPFDCTNAEGRFSFSGVPAGSWVLLINEKGKITSDEPFGKFYYPLAESIGDATVFEIGPGDFRDDLIVNAPSESADVLTISGTLVLEDGKPATSKNTKYVSIEFFTDVPLNPPRAFGLEREPESRAQIDANGRFTIRILKGKSGKLTASMGVWEGSYLNCPKLDKFIRVSKVDMPDVKSTEVPLDATSDRVGVELKFPFPSTCKLAREPEE